MYYQDLTDLADNPYIQNYPFIYILFITHKIMLASGSLALEHGFKFNLLSSKEMKTFSVSKATLQSQMSVRSFVRLFVCKTPHSLKSSSFIIHHSSFITFHSSFIILHSSFLHFATFKLFSLFELYS